ncbi:hypothetical protein Tco_1371794, partial [Tanacetum coccineum]
MGKDNGENIMKSITEGPFQMGTFIQTPAEEIEGALQLGPERARVFTDLSAEEKESRFIIEVKLNRGLKESNFDQLYAYLKQHEMSEAENHPPASSVTALRIPIIKKDSNSKALVAKDSQGEIDWTKEFDDDPVTFAMVALN